jgi:hypothetical protein
MTDPGTKQLKETAMAAKHIHHDGLIYNIRSDAATGRVVDRQTFGLANK